MDPPWACLFWVKKYHITLVLGKQLNVVVYYLFCDNNLAIGKNIINRKNIGYKLNFIIKPAALFLLLCGEDVGGKFQNVAPSHLS